MNISKADIYQIAECEFQSQTQDCKYPDCFEVSNSILDTLVDEYDVGDEHLSIRKFILPDEYHHYALYLDSEVLGTSAILDASFGQFSEESETNISIGSQDDVNDIEGNIIEARDE